MEDYKANSHKPEQERPTAIPKKKVEKVTSGTVKVKKKNEIQKFAGALISENVDETKNYIFEDIVVPAIKEVILDTVKALLGFDRDRSSGRQPSKYSYNSCFSNVNKERSKERYSPTRTRRSMRPQDVTFDNKEDANKVLDKMDDILDAYGVVSVADFFESCGKPCDYTDNYYGWDNITGAYIVKTGRNEYRIKLPKELVINSIR